MTILQVTYKSQIGATAGYSNNDCGPACIAMLLATMGQDVTIDSLYTNPSSPIRGQTGLLWVSQLITLAKSYGLNLERKNFTLPTLQQSIDAGVPVICLVTYYPVVQAGLNGVPTTGAYGHFATAVGYDANYWYVHDPYHKEQGGAYKPWPTSVFHTAFVGGYDPHSGQNYAGAGLAPTNLIAMPQQPVAPAFPVDETTLRRIRARALFERSAIPAINNQNDYNNALAWLGDWGRYAEPYFMQPGDTLAKVCARRFGSTDFAAGLAAYNGITDPNSIAVGNKILFPLPQPPGPPPAAVAPPPPAPPAPVVPSYVPPPPPPAVTAFTNQQFINAMAGAYKSQGAIGNEYWNAIVAAGLGQIINARQSIYAGPTISQLPGVPEAVKQIVAMTLGVAYP